MNGWGLIPAHCVIQTLYVCNFVILDLVIHFAMSSPFTGVKQSPQSAPVGGVSKSTKGKRQYVVEFMIAADYAIYKK